MNQNHTVFNITILGMFRIALHRHDESIWGLLFRHVPLYLRDPIFHNNVFTFDLELGNLWLVFELLDFWSFTEQEIEQAQMQYQQTLELPYTTVRDFESLN